MLLSWRTGRRCRGVAPRPRPVLGHCSTWWRRKASPRSRSVAAAGCGGDTNVGGGDALGQGQPVVAARAAHRVCHRLFPLGAAAAGRRHARRELCVPQHQQHPVPLLRQSGWVGVLLAPLALRKGGGGRCCRSSEGRRGRMGEAAGRLEGSAAPEASNPALALTQSKPARAPRGRSHGALHGGGALWRHHL